MLTFPEGEASLDPGSHAAHQGDFVPRLQPHSLALLHPLIIHIGAVAAVVFQHCLPRCTGLRAGTQVDAAVKAAHPGVSHFNNTHLWQVLTTSAVQTAAHLVSVKTMMFMLGKGSLPLRAVPCSVLGISTSGAFRQLLSTS